MPKRMVRSAKQIAAQKKAAAASAAKRRKHISGLERRGTNADRRVSNALQTSLKRRSKTDPKARYETIEDLKKIDPKAAFKAKSAGKKASSFRSAGWAIQMQGMTGKPYKAFSGALIGAPLGKKANKKNNAKKAAYRRKQYGLK